MNSEKQVQTWTAPRSRPEVDPETLAAWEKATDGLRQLADRLTLSRSEASRRSDVPLPTLTAWYDGNYKGSIANVTERIVRWLEAVQETDSAVGTPKGPGYIETRASRKIWDTLIYAQAMPSIVVVTMVAGMGKTMTARRFVDVRPNAFRVTMRPTTAGKHSMLQELALALDVVERNPARLDRAIGAKLERNGRHTLLIADEAQHLKDDAVEQLRYFHDEYGTGVALIGNDEVMSRFGRREPQRGHAQLHRRVGKRVQVLSPDPRDIEALIDAWEITDPKARKLLAGIGQKPGALGQVDETLRLAATFARGRCEPLNADHIRAAWRDRAGEES